MTDLQQRKPEEPSGADSPEGQLPTGGDPAGLPGPQEPQVPRPTGTDYELKSARTLATIATIAGPVSLIIGGVALSTVALVCGIIAFAKVRRTLAAMEPSERLYARALKQTALMGIVIAAVALTLNAVSVALMMPVLLEAMQTGDYSAILGDAAGSIQDVPGTGGGSAWG
ncbi:hypothetical protein [uncultured Adlercreutzia sp.]|uniref:hypothetical protein n=1 Tax=uncultured Adlercreutzia sp. TaxID=875803 RepID=UPI002674E276|nr:hypothetical protein [uncultured Adlercreutzia sp.]